jgi:hypothetical protein
MLIRELLERRDREASDERTVQHAVTNLLVRVGRTDVFEADSRRRRRAGIVAARLLAAR